MDERGMEQRTRSGVGKNREFLGQEWHWRLRMALERQRAQAQDLATWEGWNVGIEAVLHLSQSASHCGRSRVRAEYGAGWVGEIEIFANGTLPEALHRPPNLKVTCLRLLPAPRHRSAASFNFLLFHQPADQSINTPSSPPVPLIGFSRLSCPAEGASEWTVGWMRRNCCTVA